MRTAIFTPSRIEWVGSSLVWNGNRLPLRIPDILTRSVDSLTRRCAKMTRGRAGPIAEFPGISAYPPPGEHLPAMARSLLRENEVIHEQSYGTR